MELKAKINKHFSDNKRMDFIVEYNHKLGYEIRGTATALEAWGYTDEEIEQQEKERIAMLCLTAADVERAIYQAKGIDFNDIINLVIAREPQGIDVKALQIELKANHFYRGNQYVNAIGSLIGLTKEQLDKFFETNDYIYLLSDSSDGEAS